MSFLWSGRAKRKEGRGGSVPVSQLIPQVRLSCAGMGVRGRQEAGVLVLRRPPQGEIEGRRKGGCLHS